MCPSRETNPYITFLRSHQAWMCFTAYRQHIGVSEPVRSPQAFLWNWGQVETLGTHLLRHFTSVGVSDLSAAPTGVLAPKISGMGLCPTMYGDLQGSSSPFLLNCNSLRTVARVDRKISFPDWQLLLVAADLADVWFVFGILWCTWFHCAIVHLDLHLKFVKWSVHVGINSKIKHSPSSSFFLSFIVIIVVACWAIRRPTNVKQSSVACHTSK